MTDHCWWPNGVLLWWRRLECHLLVLQSRLGSHLGPYEKDYTATSTLEFTQRAANSPFELFAVNLVERYIVTKWLMSHHQVGNEGEGQFPWTGNGLTAAQLKHHRYNFEPLTTCVCAVWCVRGSDFRQHVFHGTKGHSFSLSCRWVVWSGHRKQTKKGCWL